MKYVLGLTFSLLSWFSTLAQVTDTLGWAGFITGTETLYESPNGGYAFGNNGYGDKAKAQTFSDTVSYVLRGSLLKFGAVVFDSQDSSSSVMVNVYRNDGFGITVTSNSDSSAPNSILTSVEIPIYELVNGGITEVDLDSDTLLVFYPDESFSIGISFDSLAVGDTIGLISTTDGDAGNTYNSWELTANDNWIVVAQAAYSWNLDVDLGIFALTDRYDPAGVLYPEDAQIDFTIYPNPADNYMRVDLSLFPNPEKLNVTIYDPSGRSVFIQNYSGQRIVEIDLNGLSSGVYLIHVLSDLGQVSKRFVKR